MADFKRELLEFISGKFADQEKLFNTRLAPIEKTQDRHTNDITELYETNRKVVDRFFSQDAKIENVKSQIMQQGERFGGKIEEIEKDIIEHKKNHDKRGSTSKWAIGITISSLIALTGLLIAVFKR